MWLCLNIAAGPSVSQPRPSKQIQSEKKNNNSISHLSSLKRWRSQRKEPEHWDKNRWDLHDSMVIIFVCNHIHPSHQHWTRTHLKHHLQN